MLIGSMVGGSWIDPGDTNTRLTWMGSFWRTEFSVNYNCACGFADSSGLGRWDNPWNGVYDQIHGCADSNCDGPLGNQSCDVAGDEPPYTCTVSLYPA